MDIKTIVFDKENFNDFTTTLPLAFDINKDIIIKQEKITYGEEKDDILITLIKLPNEYLYKKEIIYEEKEFKVIIKPYYIIVARINLILVEKLDYGAYYDTEEMALKSFEKIKQEIYKDLTR